MVQNAWERISGNLDFVENDNFVRESTKAAIRGFSGINSRMSQMPLTESYYIKVTGLKPVFLLQQSSAKGVFL